MEIRALVENAVMRIWQHPYNVSTARWVSEGECYCVAYICKSHSFQPGDPAEIQNLKRLLQKPSSLTTRDTPNP